MIIANLFRTKLSVFLAVGLLTGTSLAINIETVPVGDPGNLGELSGSGAGGYGPDRTCGSVAYSYNIGKYEVTAGQYCEFLNKVAATDTHGLYKAGMADTTYGSGISRDGAAGSYTYSVNAAFVSRPVNHVTYWDACRFANWLHNGQPGGEQGAGTTETGAYTLDGYNGTDGQTIERNAGWKWALPSEDEWYKAAYYKGGSSDAGYYDYPTSSDVAPGQDLDDTTGNNANYLSSPVSPYPIDSGKYTTQVGEFQNSASPYGTFDQAGNVMEWNEASIADEDGVFRGLRGGYHFSGAFSVMDLHAAGRSGGFPATEYSSVGFRVVQVPEPASLLILALGGVAAIGGKGSRRVRD